MLSSSCTFFVIPLSLCCDQQKSIILFAFPLSPLLFSPPFILSFFYRITDHLKSINSVFLSSSPPSSTFLIPCFPHLSSKALWCQRHFTCNPSTVQTHRHTHTRWRRVMPVQCKIHADVISADRLLTGGNIPTTGTIHLHHCHCVCMCVCVYMG